MLRCCLCLIVFVLCHVKADRENQEKPFTVVWNCCNAVCEKRDPSLRVPVRDYGIIRNEGGSFRGDDMVIFYKRQLGIYPEIQDGKPVRTNNGIPQDFVSNETLWALHEAKVKKDINRFIKHDSFSGYAVIDWEDWRPLYDRNWGEKKQYQEASMKLVSDRSPELSEKEVKKQAREEFDKAAKDLMLRTLEIGKSMRPKGKWGFYGFPKCYNGRGDAYCRDHVKGLNDKLAWMFEASTAIYPTGYILTTTKNPRNYVYSQNSEGLRVRDKFNPDVPVMVYSTFKKWGADFYNKTDLENSIGLAINMGLDGAIVWGSGTYTDSDQKCNDLVDFVNDKFGPFVESKVEAAETCSSTDCSGQGRCVKTDPLKKNPVMARDMVVQREVNEERFCRCFKGFSGENCENEI